HVEVLGRIARVRTPQCQQIVHRNAQFLSNVVPESVFDESWCKVVEPRGHCRMRGKEIARPSHCERDLEGLSTPVHETPRSLQRGERRMSFVEVTYLRFDAQRCEQSPASDAEHHLLQQSQLRSATIKLARDSTVRRIVRRIVAVEQVEGRPAYLDLPCSQQIGRASCRE